MFKKEKSDLSFAISDAVDVALDAGLNEYAKKLQEVNKGLLGKFENENPNNSWHERGELPPVGVECEWSDGGKIKNEIVKVIAYNGDFAWIKPKDGSPMTVFNPSGFRPIKSERERFIDAACSVLKDDNKRLSGIFDRLFDADFRAPSDKG